MSPEEYAERITPTDPDVLERQNRFGRALSLVGLAPTDVEFGSDVVSYREEWVDAFYSDSDGTVTIVGQGDTTFSRDAMTLLAHEYVHAMQDWEHDLEAFFLGVLELDTRLARLAVVEGEADIYAGLFHARMDRYWPTDGAWLAWIGGRIDQLQLAIEESDFPYLVALVGFPYAHGVAYVYDVWRSDGSEGVAGLFLNPPDSTHAILFTNRPASPSPEDERDVQEIHIDLPDGMVSTFVINGAWMLRTTLAVFGSLYADAIAGSWTEDAFVGLFDEVGDQAALLWIISLDTVDVATRARLEFLQVLDAVPASVTTSDERVIVVAAESDALRSTVVLLANEILDAIEAAEAANQRALIFLGR